MTVHNEILGQERPLVLLKAFLENDTIPHAFLFCGPDGVGKKTVARYFAMALNCLDSPIKQPQAEPASWFCGRCRACRLLAQDKHPDFKHIKPDGAFIKVDQVRKLIEELSLKPVEAKTRVIILEDAQHLNPAAANALLKTLEEPFPDTIFILTAKTETEVMDTILSRCQRVAFQPLDASTLAAILTARGYDPVADAGHLAYLSGGSLVKAEAMLQQSSVNRRLWLLKELAALPQSSPARILSLANELNKTKKHLPDDLDLILSWLRDLLAVKISAETIINNDFLLELQYNAGLYRMEDINAKLGILQTATGQLTNSNNTNPRLGLEYLLFALREAS